MERAKITNNNNKTKNNREIRYPLLQRVAELQTDEYWKKIYHELSYGKYMKINADSKSVYYKSTNKKNFMTYNYTDKQPETISTELTMLLRKVLVQTSRKDEQEEKKVLDNLQDTFFQSCKEDSWKKIPTHKMKELLLSNYVLELKSVQPELSWNQCRRMYSCLRDAFFTFHTHTGDHVTMKNGSIVHIAKIDLNSDPPRKLIFDSIDDFEATKLKEKAKKKRKTATVKTIDDTATTGTKKRAGQRGSKRSETTEIVNENLEFFQQKGKVDVISEWEKYILALYKKASVKDEETEAKDNTTKEDEADEEEEEEDEN